MRVFQLSLIVLAVTAALAVSALLLLRNLATETSQVAHTKVSAQEEPAPADTSAGKETSSDADDAASKAAAIAEALALSNQASGQPAEPLVTRPVGSQRSPYEPLILPPSGESAVSALAPPPEGKGARLSLTAAQEERIRYILQSHNIIQSEVSDFPLQPGGILPKEILLSPLPNELATVVPNYRAYAYVFMQDRIVIAAMNSREIGLILPF
jgi:hypothetical protein